MGVLPVALIGAALLYFMKGGNVSSAVKQLQFRNPRIKFGKLTWFNVTATVTIDVFNPTTTAVPVDFLSGNILYKGNNLSAYQVDGKATNLQIRAQATTPITFDVLISNVTAVTLVTNLINGTLSTIIDVKGNFYALGINSPFGFSYDVATKKLISNNISGTNAKQVVNGIAGVEAKLNFSSNAEMEKYFANKRANKKLSFSQN